MSNPNLATWKEEVLEMLLKDQARRSVSDAGYTELLDGVAPADQVVTPYESEGYWIHERAVAVWAEYIGAKAHRDGTGTSTNPGAKETSHE